MSGTTVRRKAQWSTVEAIKDYILDRELRPGEPLPTESALCEELGVSRSSIREAVRTLSSLDIVEVRHGHGTYVGQLTLSPLVSGLVFRSALNSDGTFRALRDVVDMRIAIDMGTAQELIQIHRGRYDEELHRLVDAMRSRTACGEPFAAEDKAFHTRLVQGLDNSLARELVAAFWAVHTQVVPMLGIAPARDIEDTVNAHEAMITALEAGDADAYRHAVLEHFRPLKRAIELAHRATGHHGGIGT